MTERIDPLRNAENERIRAQFNEQNAKMQAFLSARKLGPYGVSLVDALIQNFERLEIELRQVTERKQ